MKNINYEINRDDVYVGVVSKIDQSKIYYDADKGVIDFTSVLDWIPKEELRRIYSNQLYLFKKTPHLEYAGGWVCPQYTLRSSLFILDENGCANDLLYDCPPYPIFNISSDELCLSSPICITKAYNMGLFLAYLQYAERLGYKDIVKIRDTYFGEFHFDHCEELGVYETSPFDTGFERYDRFRNHRTFNTVKEDSPFPDTYFEMLDNTNIRHSGFAPKKDMEPNVHSFEGEIAESVEEAVIGDGDEALILSKSLPEVCDYFLIKYCVYGKALLELKYMPNYQELKTKALIKGPGCKEFIYYELKGPKHFCYQKSLENIIIGIDFSNSKWSIGGACFEEFDEHFFQEIFNSISNALPLYEYPLLELTNESVIIYKGYSFLNETSYAHVITIIKTAEGIKISYNIKDCDSRNIEPIILDASFALPVLSQGKITIAEIKKLIAELQKRFPSDDFITFIIGELEAFISRISIRNNSQAEALSAIDYKVLYDKSFSEVCDLIAANKDTYFGLLKEMCRHETGENMDIFIRERRPKRLNP